MAGIFRKAKEFLIYKEPKNEENGFELLEGENEGMMNPPGAGAAGGQVNGQTPGEDARQKKSRSLKKDSNSTGSTGPCRPPKDPEFISDRLCDNIETIKQKFHMPRNHDIVIREFQIGWRIDACLCFIGDMIDKDMLTQGVFSRLMSREIINEIGRRCPIDVLIENVLNVSKVDKLKHFTDVVLSVLRGDSVLFVDGCDECAVIDSAGY